MSKISDVILSIITNSLLDNGFECINQKYSPTQALPIYPSYSIYYQCKYKEGYIRVLLNDDRTSIELYYCIDKKDCWCGSLWSILGFKIGKYDIIDIIYDRVHKTYVEMFCIKLLPKKSEIEYIFSELIDDEYQIDYGVGTFDVVGSLNEPNKDFAAKITFSKIVPNSEVESTKMESNKMIEFCLKRILDDNMTYRLNTIPQHFGFGRINHNLIKSTLFIIIKREVYQNI